MNLHYRCVCAYPGRNETGLGDNPEQYDLQNCFASVFLSTNALNLPELAASTNSLCAILMRWPDCQLTDYPKAQ